MRNLSRNVIVLGLVSLLNDASSEIVYPLLPLFLTGPLGASASLVGLIEGVTESASSLLKLPAGWWSDRLGRRKELVLAGYGLATLVRPLLALATSAWQVLGLRMIDRVGKGVRTGPRDALLADSTAPETRGLAFGFHRAMDHLGAIAGALLAAGLFSWFHGDFRRIFWVAALPGAAALLTLLLGARDARRPEDAPRAARPAISLSRFDANFKRYLVVLLLFTLGNSSDAFLLLQARRCGLSAAMIPVLWAALHASKSLFSILGGGLSDRFGRKRLIAGGWIVYAALYVAFAPAARPWQIWFLFLAYGLYFGLTEGVEKAFVADLASAELRGTAFGLYHLTIGIGALPASLLTGWLWQRHGTGVALGTGAALSLAAALLIRGWVREP